LAQNRSEYGGQTFFAGGKAVPFHAVYHLSRLLVFATRVGIPTGGIEVKCINANPISSLIGAYSLDGGRSLQRELSAYLFGQNMPEIPIVIRTSNVKEQR
jgi:hypothetical protein